MPIREINFITSNVNKLAEVQAILSEVVSLRSQSFDLVEIQGTEEEISKDKCRKAAENVGGPVLTEDTCLCFNALNGLPGPFIKWFLQAIGHEGLNNLLLAYTDKSAEAVCTFAFCEGPGQEPLIFQGRVTGVIVPPRGPSSFGWDPIFEYKGQTYAEMDKATKNKISHRAVALGKLKAWLKIQA